MNDIEQENYLSQFKPFKQIIRVFKIREGGSKFEWFDGYLTGVTSRGLLLNPIGEYGESLDPLAASFISFPEFVNNSVAFTILKETNV